MFEDNATELGRNRFEISFANVVRHAELHDIVNSSVVVDLHLLCVSDERTNQLVYVNAAMNFSSYTTEVKINSIRIVALMFCLLEPPRIDHYSHNRTWHHSDWTK